MKTQVLDDIPHLQVVTKPFHARDIEAPPFNSTKTTQVNDREKHYHSEYPLSSAYPIANKDQMPPTERALGTQIKIVKLPYSETVKIHTAAMESVSKSVSSPLSRGKAIAAAAYDDRLLLAF
ncbi:hypothetical protein NM208_g2499 [Fusarium decemcellulare]|uniref:Uncharacterized protein n=1 Tax=Fusarium decemcellulare TaxID=57161 RepID=A0ACC1SS99_9HYPO|nr:hypothetical protein NM208_g2499 [Fusarium decemcellulare]